LLLFTAKVNVRVLLDTHTLVWAIREPANLTARVKKLLEDETIPVFYSSVSLLEMSIKYRSGKWNEVADFVADQTGDVMIASIGAIELPVFSSHARLAGSLPTDHKDPFDRLLAAQAILEQLVLLSADPLMDGFGAQRIWD
jgi:PIN domain nuclease of toxin-antitoxin system